MISPDATAIGPVCDNRSNLGKWLRELRELLLPEDHSSAADAHSPFQQFAVPYQFQPKLTVGDAIVKVFLALVRIFLGSILFALWGEYSFLTWNTLDNVFGRVLILAVLLAIFLTALGAMLIGVNVVSRRLHRVKVSVVS
jgi:hypothetical protein